MTPCLPPPSLLCRAALPLAVLAVLLAAGRATAGCGDHVVILKQTTEQQQDESVPTPVKPPCHGPNCKAGPVDHTPPLPSPVVQVTSAKELFTPIAVSAGADHPCVRWPFDLHSRLPVSRPTSIFHPPRA